MMKTTAKFPGKCRTCGESFEAGAQIAWTKVTGADCLNCAFGVDPDAPPSNVEVSEDMLKGLAAAVELSTQTGQRMVMFKAVEKASALLGVVPDIREGETYDGALSILRATLSDVQASFATSEPVGELVDEPLMGEPVAAAVVDSVYIEALAEEAEASIGMEERDPNYLVIEDELQEFTQKNPMTKPDGTHVPPSSVVESENIDPDDEDDDWLGEW